MNLSNVVLFLAATTAIALTPGPGIMYVAAQSLAGGRAIGIAASIGTWFGGLAHVVAGALGVSALVLASAEAFAALKLIGAAYLVWLGLKAWRAAGEPLALPVDVQVPDARKALRDGIFVEAFNPKSAAFFLAFVPQFVDPVGHVVLQFVALGLITVTLNTLVDVLVVLTASRVRAGLVARPRIIKRIRQTSAAVFVGLGVSLALAKRPT